jgi:hypothetical protein
MTNIIKFFKKYEFDFWFKYLIILFLFILIFISIILFSFNNNYYLGVFFINNTSMRIFTNNVNSFKRNYRISKSKIPSEELSSNLKSILYGLILGDLYCQKQTPKSNVRLTFVECYLHKEYIIHLFQLFEIYCNSSYIIRSTFDKRTNKYYENIYFNTMTSPIFNEFYDLFYKDGKKIIPKNIGELLTPISLAY